MLRSNLCALLNSMRDAVKPFLVWLLSHRLVIFWSTVYFTLAIVVLSLSITRVDTFSPWSKTDCSISQAMAGSIDLADPFQFFLQLCFLGVTFFSLAALQIRHFLLFSAYPTHLPVLLPIRVA